MAFSPRVGGKNQIFKSCAFCRAAALQQAVCVSEWCSSVLTLIDPAHCRVERQEQQQRMGKHVFVTVGTTKFNSLIQAVDNPEVLSTLSSKGYTSLTAQIGHGEHIPTFSTSTALQPSEIECGWYRFKPTLQEDMSLADMVITHAGAGSIMEALGLGKTVVAVVNDLLMDNHQKELADALAKRHYLQATTPQGLAQTLVDLDDSPSARTPYPPAKPEVFAAIVDEEMCEARGEG